MRSMRRLALLLLLVVGCSSGTPSATPTTLPPTAAADLSPTPGPTLAVRVVKPGDFTQFTSPSGNIGCALFENTVRCDVSEHTWPLPPRPAGCQEDWGSVVTLDDPGDPASVGACVGDSASGGPVLPYDQAIRVGDLQCASLRSGVSCEYVGSTHRFLVSRTVVRVQ